MPSRCKVQTPDGKSVRLFMVLVGVKGDWVFVRALTQLFQFHAMTLSDLTCKHGAMRKSAQSEQRFHQHQKVPLLLFWIYLLFLELDACVKSCYSKVENQLLHPQSLFGDLRSGGIWSQPHPGVSKGHQLRRSNARPQACTPYLEGALRIAPQIRCTRGIMALVESFARLLLWLVDWKWDAVGSLRWKLFHGNNAPDRLQSAFDSFHSWCLVHKKKSSLNKFELKTFKMSSWLGHKSLCFRQICI